MRTNFNSLLDMSVLSIHDLTVAYRGRVALQQLSGQFARAKLTAVVGPNGAGKSSLMDAIAGSAREVQGMIERPPSQRIAYLPQVSALDRSFPITVFDVVAMGLWVRIGSFRALDTRGRQAVRNAIAAVELEGFESRLIGELSVGQLQRVLFARVLVQDASLILLDEPFNAVDARTTADLLQILHGWKREGRTVVAVLHDLDLVRTHFDEVLLLARQAVAWGSTEHILVPANLAKARQIAEAWDADAAHYGGFA